MKYIIFIINAKRRQDYFTVKDNLFTRSITKSIRKRHERAKGMFFFGLVD